MRPLHFVKKLILLSFIFFCSLSHAEPMLNGIASHQELGKEQFIGALFSESISNNADTLLSATQSMRIELKILSPDGISARRFSRMWIDGMAINNSPDLLKNQAPNIVKFDSFFKGRMINGDHIVFKLEKGKGIDVSINQILLGNIKDDVFFSLLLSSWIGKIPLSSEFKDNMLKVGDVGATLRARFDQIKYASSRTGEILIWAGTTPPVASSSSSSSKATKSSVASIAVDTTPIASGLDLPPLSLETGASSSSAPTKISKNQSSVPADEEDEAPAFTTESLLARQFYIKDLIKTINQNVRYPSTALNKGQEGSVRVDVVLDRQGRVISLVASESSQYSSLTKAAEAAIKRSSGKFPPVPDAIKGETFQFTAPIRFTLMQKPKK